MITLRNSIIYLRKLLKKQPKISLFRLNFLIWLWLINSKIIVKVNLCALLSSLVNACIPQGTLTISCTPSSLASVMSQLGTSQASLAFWMVSAVVVQPIRFGSFEGGVGNLINRIPIKSLSNFGFGNLFAKVWQNDL